MNFVEKTINIFTDGALPQRLEGLMATLRGNELKPTDMLDFKKEINRLAKPQMNFFSEYVRSKTLFQMEWQLMYKLGRIRKHPELIDRDLVEKHSGLGIDRVSFFVNFV